MDIMTYDKIIMELSERLADESDYDDNLQPKLQKLLDLWRNNYE